MSNGWKEWEHFGTHYRPTYHLFAYVETIWRRSPSPWGILFSSNWMPDDLVQELDKEGGFTREDIMWWQTHRPSYFPDDEGAPIDIHAHWGDIDIPWARADSRSLFENVEKRHGGPILCPREEVEAWNRGEVFPEWHPLAPGHGFRNPEPYISWTNRSKCNCHICEYLRLHPNFADEYWPGGTLPTPTARIRYIDKNGGGAVYDNVDVLTSGIGEYNRENVIRWLEALNATKPMQDVDAVWGNMHILWRNADSERIAKERGLGPRSR